MPHIEQITSFPAMDQKHFATLNFQTGDNLTSQDQQLLAQLLSAHLDASPRHSSLMTSGYLAATAKLAVSTKLAKAQKTQAFNDESALASLDALNRCVLDEQDYLSSRRSSPGPRSKRSTLSDASIYDGMESLSLFSSLPEESKQDDTLKFCDDHNTRIKWRRRTLIFEKPS